MDSKERALLAIEALKKEYPDAICSLVYTEPLQLLIATRLAAQCTDARVNMVTPALFERFKQQRISQRLIYQKWKGIFILADFIRLRREI